MATQYRCESERRRQDVRAHATLNGIDYLEVLDREAPTPELRQRLLLVWCLKELPTGLNEDNVRIEGGVRITPVEVEWAPRASDVTDATLGPVIAARVPAAEQDFVLVVQTDQAGDFSTYRLRLVTAAGDAPLSGFDPLLAEVDFSFRVECASDFDCRTEAVCPPTPQTVPVISYLAKDYASFRQLMLDRLAVVVPDWTERSAADLGIAVVEVLAYAADHLSYFQDAVATEAYLGTARRRPSVRRHARLLDYPMHDGCNARAWVCFEVEGGGGADGLLLTGGGWDEDGPPAGLSIRLLTRVPGEGAMIHPDRFEDVRSTHQPAVFELMEDVTLRAVHNEIRFYTWGEEECCVPRGATHATLREEAATPLQLQPGDVLVFEEVLGATTGAPADADPAHRHAVRLTAVTRSTDALYDVNVVDVEWLVQDALPFPLCVSKTIGLQLYENMTVARGNVALADHGRTIADEALPDPREGALYRPLLAEPDVTHGVPYERAAAIAAALDGEPPGAAAAALTQDPREALPVLRVTDLDAESWSPRRDLLDSDRFERHLVVEVQNDGVAGLRFGDDTYGMEPLTAGRTEEEMETSAERWRATYRVGNGAAGNVGAGSSAPELEVGSIAHIVAAGSGIEQVWNPLPARGGTNPESLDEVRLYAPQAFRFQERAVTEADYASAAQRHPDVQRAAATRRWTGSWHTTFVTVDRKGGRAVDASFEAAMRAHLRPFELAGHDVEIDGPRYVPLDVAFTVCVKPGYFQAEVKQALLEAFSNRDLPDGRRGFFHPDHFTFGQPVYLSQVIATAMQVPGVQGVDVDGTPPKPNRFQRWGQTANDEIANGVLPIGRLEIARLDNDPNARENGRLAFFMQGGQ